MEVSNTFKALTLLVNGCGSSHQSKQESGYILGFFGSIWLHNSFWPRFCSQKVQKDSLSLTEKQTSAQFLFHVFQFYYNTREIGNEWWRIQKTRLHSPELSNLLRFWKMRKGEYHVFHSLFLVRYKYETIILVLHCVVTALATNLVMKLHVGLKQINPWLSTSKMPNFYLVPPF